MPDDAECPLCPGGKEIAQSEFDIVVFDNRHPSLPPIQGKSACEVVVYTDRHDGAFADLEPDRAERLVEVWLDRYLELGALDGAEYLYIFENRGKEVGVTLTHPHGQIYAFSYLPPVVEKALIAQMEHDCLICGLINEGETVFENKYWRCWAPSFARFPYETWLAPKRHARDLSDLSLDERRLLGRALLDIAQRYDALWADPMPLMMAQYPRPTDGQEHGYWHFHIIHHPLRRDAHKLKYLAGCETGAGTFITDVLPENAAERLKNARSGDIHEL